MTIIYHRSRLEFLGLFLGLGLEFGLLLILKVFEFRVIAKVRVRSGLKIYFYVLNLGQT